MKSRKQNCGFTLVELLVTIGIIGLLAALLLPVLSQSKVKSKRIQCLSNLNQIGRALNGYGNDHGGRLPWQILPSDQKVELGTGWHDFTMDPGAIFSLPPMKLEIGTVKVLLSPLDPERAAANESAESKWDKFDPTSGVIIPTDAISYLLAEGGDLGRPGTVLATTRNLSKCDLAEARWVGADEYPIPRDAMAGLMKGKGNVVLGDGSSHLSNDSDLGPTGRFTREHQISSGGKTKGAASTVMLGCCGGYEIVPITKVFNTTNGNHHAFIIDKSGSMMMDNRFGLAQRALVDSLRLLGPQKKFYVHFFDNGSRPWVNDTNSSKYALKWEVDEAETWIKGLRPGGGTNPTAALKDVFTRIAPDTIWLLTDGMFNRNTNVRNLILKLNSGQSVTVNTVGFHRKPGNVDPVLGNIAQDNNGTFYFSRSYPGGKPPNQ